MILGILQMNGSKLFWYSKTDKVMKSVMYLALRLLTNIALIGVRQMRTITIFYLTNLTVSDLSFVMLIPCTVLTAVHIVTRLLKRGDPWAATSQCAAINSSSAFLLSVFHWNMEQPIPHIHDFRNTPLIIWPRFRHVAEYCVVLRSLYIHILFPVATAHGVNSLVRD